MNYSHEIKKKIKEHWIEPEWKLVRRAKVLNALKVDFLSATVYIFSRLGLEELARKSSFGIDWIFFFTHSTLLKSCTLARPSGSEHKNTWVERHFDGIINSRLSTNQPVTSFIYKPLNHAVCRPCEGLLQSDESPSCCCYGSYAVHCLPRKHAAHFERVLRIFFLSFKLIKIAPHTCWWTARGGG